MPFARDGATRGAARALLLYCTREVSQPEFCIVKTHRGELCQPSVQRTPVCPTMILRPGAPNNARRRNEHALQAAGTVSLCMALAVVLPKFNRRRPHPANPPSPLPSEELPLPGEFVHAWIKRHKRNSNTCGSPCSQIYFRGLTPASNSQSPVMLRGLLRPRREMPFISERRFDSRRDCVPRLRAMAISRNNALDMSDFTMYGVYGELRIIQTTAAKSSPSSASLGSHYFYSVVVAEVVSISWSQ
jgi:hypothetical protein